MIYRFAKSSADYKKCHALMGEDGELECGLTFPTIIAEDEEGELVGFVSTRPKFKNKGFVVAGPLVVRNKRPIVAFRLGEAYDLFMNSVGILYFMFVPDPNLAAQYKRLGFVVHKEEEDGVWLKNREVSDVG